MQTVLSESTAKSRSIASITSVTFKGIGDRKQFETIEQAESWRNANLENLTRLHAETLAIEGVCHAETWLCGACPSFIAGFGDDDQIVVCMLIQ